MLVNSLF